MGFSMLEREMKRGSAELLILALLEDHERHGYDIGKQIELRSGGTIAFHITSLYPTLYRLQSRGLIEGRWVEQAGQRRRRYYRLTPGGRGTLVRQRSIWQTFASAINKVAGIKNV
jgi:DNA-binding PadR family transcriptional regulator